MAIPWTDPEPSAQFDVYLLVCCAGKRSYLTISLYSQQHRTSSSPINTFFLHRRYAMPVGSTRYPSVPYLVGPLDFPALVIARPLDHSHFSAAPTSGCSGLG
jgi:hypothetical protein